MKMRKGFVSNSSSSSFIVAYKGELDKDKLKAIIRRELLKPDSPIFQLVDGIVEKLTNAEEIEKEKLAYNEHYLELVKKGYTVLLGSADDQSYDDLAETVLCDLGLDFKSDDIIVEKDADY